jgi:hypothetical protein
LLKHILAKSVVSALSLAGLLAAAVPAGADPAPSPATVCQDSKGVFGCPGSPEGEPEKVLNGITGKATPQATEKNGAEKNGTEKEGAEKDGKICGTTVGAVGCAGSPEGKATALIETIVG